jgi:hypothetical protein
MAMTPALNSVVPKTIQNEMIALAQYDGHFCWLFFAEQVPSLPRLALSVVQRRI